VTSPSSNTFEPEGSVPAICRCGRSIPRRTCRRVGRALFAPFLRSVAAGDDEAVPRRFWGVPGCSVRGNTTGG
jgi:hypothetical protein